MRLWPECSPRWKGPCGADADHLKTCDDVDAMFAAGFTFFTIDPSDYVDQNADDYDEPTLREQFKPVRSNVAWYEDVYQPPSIAS